MKESAIRAANLKIVAQVTVALNILGIAYESYSIYLDLCKKGQTCPISKAIQNTVDKLEVINQDELKRYDFQEFQDL